MTTQNIDLSSITFDLDELEKQSEFVGYVVRDTIRMGNNGPYWALLIWVPETESYETKNINWVDPKDKKRWAQSGLKAFLETLRGLGIKTSAPGSLTGKGLVFKYEAKSFKNKAGETINYQSMDVVGVAESITLEECERLAAEFDRRVVQAGQAGQARATQGNPGQARVSPGQVKSSMPEGEDMEYIVSFLDGKDADSAPLAAARDGWFKERAHFRTGVTTGALVDALIGAGIITVDDAGVYARA